MGLIRATFFLFAIHLRRLLSSRRVLACVGISLLPVAAALFIHYIARYVGPPPAVELGWLLVVQLVVPIVALILGSAVIAEEVEDQTITYVFTRPVPRMSVLLGRWLASSVVIVALLGASAWLTVVILDTSATPSPEQTMPSGAKAALVRVAILGSLVYGGLFAAVGAWVKHPVLVGLGYTFVVEGFLGNLPGKNQVLTVQYYLRSYLCGQGDAIRERIEFMVDAVEVAPADEAVNTLLAILAVALALGCLIVSRRQYITNA